MDDDIVEKPVQRLLFRQSSLETRLSPVHLSEDSGSDTEEVSKPKIVDVIRKSSQSSETLPASDENKKVNFKDEEKNKMPQNEISVATIKGTNLPLNLFKVAFYKFNYV